MRISDTMRRNDLKYVYYEKLSQPRIASVIARETGARTLLLNPAHNLAKEDMARGLTFISIMEENLENLKTGLECR